MVEERNNINSIFNFDSKKLSALCNTIEQMSATAEDKGDDTFRITLTHEDEKMIVRGLLLLEESKKMFKEKVDELKRNCGGDLTWISLMLKMFKFI